MIQIKRVLSQSRQKDLWVHIVSAGYLVPLVLSTHHSSVPWSPPMQRTSGDEDGMALHRANGSRTGASTRSGNGCIIWSAGYWPRDRSWIVLLGRKSGGCHPASLILKGLFCVSNADESGLGRFIVIGLDTPLSSSASSRCS